MHHALQIEEILSNIFGHCYSRDGGGRNGLRITALARACRAFKEPALDVLWQELYNLSPLAQCLPEASRKLFTGNLYSFSRPLTQTEWDILQSYTRRIRSIDNFHRGLDGISMAALSKPPTTRSLFPNLRHLCCEYTTETMLLLHLPLPSLISLDVEFENPRLFQYSLQSFPAFSPNVRKLSLSVHRFFAAPGVIDHNYISRWSNLHSVLCSEIALNADALVHLSRMSAMT
ncbi:hypothetical protein OG21DRAFT_371973 [Imleria badia]|nr:hypothetical protein OG21DRAFT_371973 [Imleria badia]